MHSGRLDFAGLVGLPDDAAMAELTQVKGVGPWSAEMFLIHEMKRPDVLPAGDLGIRLAIQREYSLIEPPPILAARQRGEAWAPYRTYAAALLWRSLRAL